MTSFRYAKLLLATCFLLVAKTTVAVSTRPEKDFEKFLFETYNLIDKDPEEFKSRFAKDNHEIKLCFNGLTEEEGCWQGNVDTTFGSILENAKRMTWGGKWFSPQDDKGGFYFAFISFDNHHGCSARVTATIYHEVNDEHKITKLYAYSEDSRFLVNCLRPKEKEEES